MTLVAKLKSFGTTLALGAAVVSSLGLTGCKDAEVAGTVAIVAGAIAIDSARDSRCYGTYDRWGRYHSRCRYYSATIAAPALEADAAVARVASKYNLPLESAATLTELLNAKDGLASLGLAEGDVKKLARYSMPSDSGLDRVAETLKLSRSSARDLVQALMDDTKEQMADVDSPAWTACMAGGKWKTDANGGTCKSVDWKGCSPATGANMCAASK